MLTSPNSETDRLVRVDTYVLDYEVLRDAN